MFLSPPCGAPVVSSAHVANYPKPLHRVVVRRSRSTIDYQWASIATHLPCVRSKSLGSRAVVHRGLCCHPLLTQHLGLLEHGDRRLLLLVGRVAVFFQYAFHDHPQTCPDVFAHRPVDGHIRPNRLRRSAGGRCLTYARREAASGPRAGGRPRPTACAWLTGTVRTSSPRAASSWRLVATRPRRSPDP
jgi:hypothetical protein